MHSNGPRSGKLFYSLDRSPLLTASAILASLFVLTAMVMNGLPRIGGAELPIVNNPISVPDADKDDALVLTVKCDGSVFWRHDKIPVADLAPKIRDRARGSAEIPRYLVDPRVYLNVDARTRYKDVAKVLNAIRLAGVGEVAFLVDQRKTALRPSIFDANQPNLIWNVYLWRSMDGLGRVVIVLLALMLMNIAGIICYRLYCYSAARRQSRAFARDATSAVRSGNFDEVITVAVRNNQSHVARVVAEGLAAYVLAPPGFTNTEAIAAAQRACQRSRKLLAARLGIGLGTVATIASSAPFIGFLGTVDGIVGAFHGTAMEHSSDIAAVMSDIARALTLSATGLLVAVFARWSWNCLRGGMEEFETEMLSAERGVVRCINAHPRWRERFPPPLGGVPISFAQDGWGARSWEVPYDRHRTLFFGVWCCVLFLGYLIATDDALWRGLFR